MRPTFLGFETAKRGLSATQKAIDITGNNISNISTAGYTRQRVDTVSMSLSGVSTRFATNKIALAGQGVSMTGVSQTRDAFLDKRFREEYVDVAYYDQTASTLDDVQSALDEVTSNGMKSAITKMSNALQELSKNADQATYANIALTAGKSMAQVLNQFNTKLNNILEQQKTDTQTAVEDVNKSLVRIAAINEAISKDITSNASTSSEYYGPNELLDERNLLLDKLSAYGELNVTDNGDGTVGVDMNGHTVVDGSKNETVNMVRNQDNTISINWQSTGSSIDATTGSFKASLDMINGRGRAASGANENYEQGIPYYKDKIDKLANVLAQEFNNVIPTVDADGKATGDYKQLFAASDGKEISAGNIAVSEAWNNKPTYIIDSVKTDGSVDNTYVTALYSKLSKDMDFGEFSGTFEEYVTFYNTTVGDQVDFSESRLEATSAIADEVLDRRDDVSSVSSEEEGTNLMLYQKAYNAVARVMTTMDEILDTLINSTGLVGRG